MRSNFVDLTKILFCHAYLEPARKASELAGRASEPGKRPMDPAERPGEGWRQKKTSQKRHMVRALIYVSL